MDSIIRVYYWINVNLFKSDSNILIMFKCFFFKGSILKRWVAIFYDGYKL